MDSLRIVLADDEAAIAAGLSLMLQNLGYKVIGCASCGREAVELTRKLLPDLVILDIRMEHDWDGLAAAKHILEFTSLPIVMLTALADQEVIETADAVGVAGYIVKPFSRNQLQSVLTLSWSSFKQMQKMRLEIGNLQETLKARKLIEQAKGLLMEREQITEAEAYKRMQTMSRNQNIAMIKLAEAIIMTEKLAKKPSQAHKSRLPASGLYE